MLGRLCENTISRENCMKLFYNANENFKERQEVVVAIFVRLSYFSNSFLSSPFLQKYIIIFSKFNCI